MTNQNRKNTSIINKKLSIFITTLSVLFFALVIVLNLVFGDQLFIRGVNFVYSYQKAQPSKVIVVIQNIISLFGSQVGTLITLFLSYILSKRKMVRLIHTSFFLFAVYVSGLLKQAKQQPRPTWYDDRIESYQWFCPKDFGSPSGHCFIVFVLYQPILTDSIGLKKWRALLIIPLLILFTVTPLSRMYLGVHSTDQVLYGILLGLIFLVFFRFFGQKSLYKLFWNLLKDKNSFKILRIVLLTLSNIIIIGIPIIVFQKNRSNKPIPEYYITNMNQLCHVDQDAHFFYAHSLDFCAYGPFIFGVGFGFLFLKNRMEYTKYFLGKWTYNSWLMVFLKILFYGIFAILPAFVFFLLGDYAAKSDILKYIFECLGYELGGFGFTFLVPILSKKAKIMNFQEKLPQAANIETPNIPTTQNL